MKSYENTPAETHSALVLVDVKTKKRVQGVHVARQFFKPISEDVVDEIIAQGDIMYCAGGFIVDIGNNDALI